MNTVTFFAPSGSPASGTVIQQLDPPGNTSGANRIGFFGTGGPGGTPFAVIVNSYQDRTFITNQDGGNLGLAPYGVLGSGELLNHKFLTTSTVNVNRQDAVSLTSVPIESGTLLVVFEASGASSVQTQNAVLRTVSLNASSGVNDITAIVQNLAVQGYEITKDSSWTKTGGTSATDNRLFLTDHSTAAARHDFYIGLACSPEATGERTDFGFLFVLEFL